MKHNIHKVEAYLTTKLGRPFYETKGVKFCTEVPRTRVHKPLVLDFHLLA